MRYYAGIGSRETPNDIQDKMQEIAMFLSRNGYTLRSGAAAGADKSFELGCDDVGGYKEIYLPWKGFNLSTSTYVLNSNMAYSIASKFHPAWDKLSDGAKKLQARNTHQVLGWDFNTPSEFIICWTPNGSSSGGTGQAIRMAKHYNIPVFDLGNNGDLDRFRLYYVTNIINKIQKQNKENIMISVMNLHKKQPINPWDVKVDRSSVLGNPFHLKDITDVLQREHVCNMYEEYFTEQLKVNTEFKREMNRLYKLYKQYGQLNLFCWCAPAQCHADTIRSALILALVKNETKAK